MNQITNYAAPLGFRCDGAIEVVGRICKRGDRVPVGGRSG